MFFFSVHCLLISSARPDLQKAMELLLSGVTEESINDMTISGADAYGLGPRKSVYKCAYQFMRRRYMMALFLGLPDLTMSLRSEAWELTRKTLLLTSYGLWPSSLFRK